MIQPTKLQIAYKSEDTRTVQNCRFQQKFNPPFCDCKKEGTHWSPGPINLDKSWQMRSEFPRWILLSWWHIPHTCSYRERRNCPGDLRTICLKGILEEFTLGMMPASKKWEHCRMDSRYILGIFQPFGSEESCIHGIAWLHLQRILRSGHQQIEKHSQHGPIAAWLDLVCHAAKNTSILQPLAKCFVTSSMAQPIRR